MLQQSPKPLNELLNLVLINLIPTFLLILECTDLKDVLRAPSAYPFGTEKSTISIYTSQRNYLIYTSLHILMLIGLIGLSFVRRRFRRAFYVTLVLNLIAFFYPLITEPDVFSASVWCNYISLNPWKLRRMALPVLANNLKQAVN